MGMIKDFKDFALKGNVLDLAIGVIIGAAFAKIISSLVEDIIMPPIGLLINGIDFSKLAYQISDGVINPATGKLGDPVFIRYGNFLQICIQFAIVAFVIFLIVKGIMAATRKKEAAIDAPAGVPEASAQEKLLGEIRDLLRSRPV